MPENDTVRGDLADYLWEVQRFDREVGEVITKLESIGELENTIVVISGDNGMPFPRCKATLYDQGTRVPLAIRWGSQVPGGRSVSDFVSLCDLAPTFLDACGLAASPNMTGRSLLPILCSPSPGQIDLQRTFVVTGMEKHVYSSPSRAIRTKDFLYIRNFTPQQWKSGEVPGQSPAFDFATQPWPTDEGAFSFNIDPSPSKQFLLLNRDHEGVVPFAELAFGQRSAEEFYDLRRDPDQIHNLINDEEYSSAGSHLRRKLDAEMIRSDDPRAAVPGYTDRSLEGWVIRVSDRLLNNEKGKTEAAIDLLRQQLATVAAQLPGAIVERLRDVPIWMSPEYKGVRPTAEYHPDSNWLQKAGRPAALVKCVELTNISIFPQECRRMPMLIMHELAHAYHDQVLGFDNAQSENGLRAGKSQRDLRVCAA